MIDPLGMPLVTQVVSGEQADDGLYIPAYQQIAATRKGVDCSSGTMTYRIDRLEQAELVKRVPDSSDRRGVLIELTNKGFNLIEKAVKAHVANLHRILSALEESERQALTHLLRKLLVSFEE
ncbi:MarR family transcriptional regulator [Nostoc parmelioides FACHB-3921]|uniref:MarR family transcriptional regulator n=1 Tax=Nostoc parmelioides FACHB-3921 TaxID=2692909 RepID=A0ABR8BB73_9NOSO|nr:MarR family transcriptional regulator [Nostoc parmelioides]MBD2251338.1 MarR family transcriptional regulator [Nostoc parmelioides FACHB-3921]